MLRRLLTRPAHWVLLVLLAVSCTLFGLPSLAGAQSAGSAVAAHQGSRPTIVLVHGAFADSSSWDEVIPILEHEGYHVLAPPNPLRSLSGDAAYIASFLKTIPGPIVLVGHSYGGMVITNAATGNPNVKALVYVDAFMPAAGESAQQLAFAMPGSCLEGGGKLSNVFNMVTNPSQPSGDPDLYIKFDANTEFTGWDACFANYVQPTQAYELWAGQRPIALGAFTDPSGPPAWASIPSWAVIGRDDNAIPPAELTFMAQRAHSQMTYVTAGHLSMISKPGVVAKVITEAARAEG
jgi:pimeloyl-ACP methyl ester carboxylesterase